MITVLLASFSFNFSMKELLFFSKDFFLEKGLLFLILIFPLVFFLIWSMNFVFVGSSSSKLYSSCFLSVFIFLFLCFTSNSSFFFLLYLESCVVFMIVLIFFFSKDKDKMSSVSFMFFTNILGSIPFMFFCTSLSSCFYIFEVVAGSQISKWVLFCFYLMLISKIPIYFFHFWLTKAHVSASGSGSMILASLMLKIGTLGLYKFCSSFLKFSQFKFHSWVSSFSLFSCLLLSLVMVRFFDVKYLVACSSIVHMGLIFPCCWIYSPSGVIASLWMMSGHGIISCFVFFLISVCYELVLNRSSESNKSLESFSKTFGLFLFFFFLMNMGFPPFISFLSEFLFISFFFFYSLISSLFLLVSLIVVGKVFMFIILNFLFSKGSKSFNFSSEIFIISVSVLYFLFFFYLPGLF